MYVNDGGNTVTDSQEMEIGTKDAAEAYANQFNINYEGSKLQYTPTIRGPYNSSLKSKAKSTPPSGTSYDRSLPR